MALDLIDGSEYFGERALMYDEARAATVRAATKLVTVGTTRSAFEKLFGPLQDLLEADRLKRVSLQASWRLVRSSSSSSRRRKRRRRRRRRRSETSSSE